MWLSLQSVTPGGSAHEAAAATSKVTRTGGRGQPRPVIPQVTRPTSARVGVARSGSAAATPTAADRERLDRLVPTQLAVAVEAGRVHGDGPWCFGRGPGGGVPSGSPARTYTSRRVGGKCLSDS
jgi:hypothetical protein